MCEVDGVLHDVAFLVECRRDVDGGVGDDQGVLAAGHVHHEAMADAPLGAQPRAARHNRGHQFIRVQRAFHQGFCLPLMYELYGDFCRRVTVRHIDDGQAAEVKLALPGGRLELGARRHQYRCNQTEARGFDHRGQGIVIAWMCNGGR